MPTFPGPDVAAAWWTWQSLDDGGTLLAEQGKSALHLTPTNLAAPNYGLGSNGKTGKLTLNGANQYGVMPAAAAARWYANAPTSALTVGFVATWDDPTANDVIFSCLNAGPTRGLTVKLSTSARVQVAGYDAAGAVKSATFTADQRLAGSTRVVVIALQPSASLALAWIDGTPIAATFAGTTTSIAYDTAVMPTIGSIPGGGNYHDGDLFPLCIWPRVLLASEVAAWTSYWRDRT